MGYLTNPNNWLLSVSNGGGTQTVTDWGLASNGYPTPYITDAYGNGMMAKNVDRHWINNTAHSVFLPNNSLAERNAAFRYAGANTGMTVVDGYIWNPSIDSVSTYGNTRTNGPAGSAYYFWSNTAAYPSDGGFCWNGSPGYVTWGTPPGCPSGFTDDGVSQQVVTSYLDFGQGANAGGGALNATNLIAWHGSISWQFYQYFTWGCASPGYPYFGASVRYCKKQIGTV